MNLKFIKKTARDKIKSHRMSSWTVSRTSYTESLPAPSPSRTPHDNDPPYLPIPSYCRYKVMLNLLDKIQFNKLSFQQDP